MKKEGEYLRDYFKVFWFCVVYDKLNNVVILIIYVYVKCFIYKKIDKEILINYLVIIFCCLFIGLG